MGIGAKLKIHPLNIRRTPRSHGHQGKQAARRWSLRAIKQMIEIICQKKRASAEVLLYLPHSGPEILGEGA
ncbi:MAG: hypothetical protein JW990_04935 [Thermoleophilia bacterium]|nr:hypothetical protein [Thermoleophilia bacterium]